MENIYLKFGDDIETSDKNKDGIDDYYEYMMCQGILKTRSGTKVFEGVDYNTLMKNSDYDNDLVKNGDEIEIVFYNDKPYVSLHSDPTLINSDRDQFNDFQEYNNCTNPLVQSYLINTDEYREIYNKGDYVYTEQADKYLNKSFLGIKKVTFDYFVDAVFCGSENYFDILASAVGGEDLIVQQDKKLLVEYLSNLLNIANSDVTNAGAIDVAITVTKGGKDFLDSLEKLVDDKSVSSYINEDTKKAIAEERKAIAKLNSEIDIRRNNKTIDKASYNSSMEEIARRQSDLDHGRFAETYQKDFKNHKEKYNKRFEEFGNVLDFVEFGYARYSSITNIVENSNKIAKFAQFKSFLKELSKSDFDYLAEAAYSVLKEINDQEDGNYNKTALSQYVYETIGDAVNIGLDKAIEKASGSAGAVLTITKIVLGVFLGKNLSLQRENLLIADFTTPLVIIALNDVINYGEQKDSKIGQTNYLYEGGYYCNISSNLMMYAISARLYGEDKYLDLSEERSGIIGWLFDYNPLDHSSSTISKAYNNTKSLEDKLLRYYVYSKV